MNKTVLVIGIIFLLIGVSVVSSTGNLVEDTHTNYQPIESIDISKETVSRGNIAYAYIAYEGSPGHPEGLVYFPLDDPWNITFLEATESAYFLSGGTWTCDDKWFGCEYNTGKLWEIDIETGDMTQIGGGGTACNGLAWDPVYNRLYGASSTHLIEYEPETGDQETIGSFGLSGKTIFGIAIDSEGVCYAWDAVFSGSATLWTVDLETGEATEVCRLTIGHPRSGHFDFNTDILYLSTSDKELYECDEDTGECTLVGNIGEEVTSLVIPYNCTNHPPNKPTINGPTNGKPGVEYNYTFVTTDPDGDYVWYHISWGDKEIIYIYGPYPSGEEITLSYNWSEKGTFIITCWARDIYDAESNITTLEVTMPRYKVNYNSLFLRFLERFPLLQRLFYIWKWNIE